MPRKRSPAEVLRQANKRASGKDKSIVNGERAARDLQPEVIRRYLDVLALWDEYVASQNPHASVYDLESLQDFAWTVAHATEGRGQDAQGRTTPGELTIRKRLNDFTAAWVWKNHNEIPHSLTSSLTTWILTVLSKEMNLAGPKRPRRFATQQHLLHYARQLWTADWFEYKVPATRLDDWALHLCNTFSSSRIGEYIESTCRTGTGRGLYYKDIIFSVFWNEFQNVELAIQLTRDAKNMTKRAEKRPQHALYEGKDPTRLCFNPILPLLARLLVHGAFRDYRSIEDILQVEPPEGEMQQLYWKDDLLNKPFFKSQQGPAEKIETAGAFSNRFRALGHRAGYAHPPTCHDWRAEGLYLVAETYKEESTRKVHAGHSDPNTLAQHYMPRNAADGQGAYLGRQGRSHVLELFRGLSLPRNPNVWQCLPAEKQYKVHNSQESLDLNEEIHALMGATDKESTSRRNMLYRRKRQLLNEKLREWQKQPQQDSDRAGYHRSIFNRVRFMMPERDRLASNLFEVAPLRSSVGLAVLRDMMALYRKSSEVDYRPGLEPNKCDCRKDDFKCSLDPRASYSWKHIYTCYKNRSDNSGFIELCFLCSEWFSGSEAWDEHCTNHLRNVDAFPVYCDPLMYGGVLATAGYCPFCLTKEELPASKRMHQFLNRGSWLNHIHKHVQELDESKPAECLYPDCGELFEFIQQLQFHLQDVHGVNLIKMASPLKRSRDEGDETHPIQKKRQGRKYKEEEGDGVSIKMEHAFVNITIETMSLRKPRRINSSSSSSMEDETLHTCEKPPSSICSEELIDPAILWEGSGADPNAYNTAERNGSEASSIQDDPSYERDALFVSPAIVADLQREENPVLRISGYQVEDSAPDYANEELKYDQPPALDPEDNQWRVEKLVEKRRIGRAVKYLVKWLGYPDSENSWERKKDIDPDIVAAFEAELLLAQD